MKEKIQQKLTKHFTILCNGNKVKILNYKLKQEQDGKLVLELITKIPNILLSQKNIRLEISDKKQPMQLYCTWLCELSEPNVKRYYYEVHNMKEL